MHLMPSDPTPAHGLQQDLTDMIDSDVLPHEFYDLGFKHFDTAMHAAYGSGAWGEPKAKELNGRIHGTVVWY